MNMSVVPENRAVTPRRFYTCLHDATRQYASYADWREQALATDERTGAARWKADDRSTLFDYRVIRRRLDELLEVRESGNALRLLHYFDEGMHGNMGGMGSAALYRQTAVGTKNMITQYVSELAAGLEQLADMDELPLETKIEFFRRARHAYGRASLMLSGAGALGPFHFGVARALLEQGLLPDVVSGASAGAVVAAILCTRNDAELEPLLAAGDLARGIETLKDDDADRSQNQITVEYLRALIDHWIPDLTFGEALAHSGRNLNVSVAPSEVHQQSRALNAVTSPNVLIREAVLASCSIPGLFPPVALAARAPNGNRVPYVQSRTWVDGSISDDTPARRLARIYGCNFFITSQANPLAMWSVQDPATNHPLALLFAAYRSAAKEWYRSYYPFAVSSVQNVYPFNVMTRMFYSLLTQDDTADVVMTPGRRFRNPGKFLLRLTPADSMELVQEGEQVTWPNIERIRNATIVGHRLDEMLARLTRQTSQSR